MTKPVSPSAGAGGSQHVASPYVPAVDDDGDIRAVIRITLEEDGHSVVTAANGRQALDRVAERQDAVVLVDLTLPVMNGWEFNGRLQEMGLGVPVIFMTAAFRAEAEAETHGAAGHCAKPFDINDLLLTVERFVRGT